MTEKVKTFVMDGGLNVDLPLHAVPENTWNGGSRVIFRNGIATREPGYASVTATTDYPLALQQAKWYTGSDRQEQNRLYYLANDISNGDARLWVWDGTTHTDITPGAGWDATKELGPVSVGQLNDWIYTFNSGFHQPIYVSMYFPTTAAILPGWPAGSNALVLRSFHEFLVALNIMEVTAGPTNTNYPDQVWWSDAALPDTVPQYWVPAATNQAGNAFLGTGGGAIVDGLSLRDRFLIYKRNAVWLMEKTGGNEIFSFRQLFNEFGCMGPNCVASDGNLHYVFTGKDIIATDGSRWSSILQTKARNLVSAAASGPANYMQSNLFYNRVSKELTLRTFVTATTAAGISIDVESGFAGVRNTVPQRLPGLVRDWQSAPVEGEAWTAQVNGQAIYRLDSGVSSLGSANIVRYLMTFDQPSQHKVVRWVRPHYRTVAGSVTMTVEGAGTNHPDSAISFGAAATVGADGKADVFAEGRFISLRFATTTDGTWTLPAFDVCYEVSGGY